MSTIGPEMPGQLLYAVGSLGKPPSCTSTTIDFTPLRSIRFASRLAVATSSENFRPSTPDLVTMLGVFSRVIPMKPTLMPSYSLTLTAGNTVLPVSVRVTLAARYWKFAPGKVPAGQEFWLSLPSPSGRQPPVCMRRSSRQPSSNSWLPTLAICSPIRFIAMMVGSSWNAADSSGVAPMRSPAATVTVCRPLERARVRSLLRCVARYSAPPAGVPLMTPELEDVLGSSWPWKSLSARICSFTLCLTGFLADFAATAWPWASAGATPVEAISATEVTAATPRAASSRRRGGDWDMGEGLLVGSEFTEIARRTKTSPSSRIPTALAPLDG